MTLYQIWIMDHPYMKVSYEYVYYSILLTSRMSKAWKINRAHNKERENIRTFGQLTTQYFRQRKQLKDAQVTESRVLTICIFVDGAKKNSPNTFYKNSVCLLLVRQCVCSSTEYEDVHMSSRD